jgi:UDPglucose 6-dehydrogenase
MKVTVIGTGYVGLVAGACLAELGHQVIGVDNDLAKLDKLRAGISPIYEPGLDQLLAKNLRAGRLVFTSDTGASVRAAEVVLIAVGTPPTATGGADLRHVDEVASTIGQALDRYTLVVTKSTVPVGTHARIRTHIAAHTTQPFEVASNPEFLREGVAVRDFLEPDRVVLGVSSARAERTLRALYEPLAARGVEVIAMDPASAELTKYASNAMLATRISFINEIANLCEKVGANVDQVRLGMGADRRIGPSYLVPGLGYGGSCFPKDVAALLRAGDEAGSPLFILEAAEAANRRQKLHFVEILRSDFGGDLTGVRVAVWGLAFKPETDDMREAPSIPLTAALVADGAEVQGFDPVAMEAARKLLDPGVKLCRGPMEAVAGADALVLATEWSAFREPDWSAVRQSMRGNRVYDGRNLWPPEVVRAAGLVYRGVGRPVG